MSEEVHWVVTVAVKPGQLEAFKSVMTDMVASTAKEDGALAYEWHFNSDETECTIYERYVDSQAVATHFGNFGAHADRFVSACDRKHMTVLGHPTDVAKEFLDRAEPTYLSHAAGFARFKA